MQHQEALLEQLERERTENQELKIRIHRIETEYNSYVTNETDLLEMNSRFKIQVDSMTAEVHKARDEVSRSRDIREKELSEHRNQWTEEKLNLQGRVDGLENQLSQTQVKVVQLTNSEKKVWSFICMFVRDCSEIITDTPLTPSPPDGVAVSSCIMLCCSEQEQHSVTQAEDSYLVYPRPPMAIGQMWLPPFYNFQTK